MRTTRSINREPGTRKMRTSAFVLALAALIVSVPAPSYAAADPQCTVTIQSADFVSNADGRFLAVQANLSCANFSSTTGNWTQAGISISRDGSNVDLEANGANNTSAPLGQARNCQGSNSCTIYVSARDTDARSTYKIHAWGFAMGPSYEGAELDYQSTASRTVFG